MQVIRQDGVGQNIDCKDGRQALKLAADHFFAKRVVDPRFFIDSRQKSPTHTPLNGVHNANFVGCKLFAAYVPTHDRSP
jgi:hypothetical protein